MFLPPDAVFPGSPAAPAVTALVGDDDFDSEELIAYELGFRYKSADHFSFDVSAFYNDYEKLMTGEPASVFFEPLPSPPHFVVPLKADNEMKGEVYGIEFAADWQPLDWWQLKGAYTYLQMQLHFDADFEDTLFERAEGASPHHQISVRSAMDFSDQWNLDLWLRYVDNLPSQDIPSYLALDVRLGWRPYPDLELSIVGQNLLDDQRPEFRPEFLNTLSTEPQRSVYGKLTWRF
jgi:iron complex outermembrane receptor protein